MEKGTVAATVPFKKSIERTESLPSVGQFARVLAHRVYEGVARSAGGSLRKSMILRVFTGDAVLFELPPPHCASLVGHPPHK